MEVIKMSLSVKSMENAKREIRSYKQEIRRKAEETVRRLASYGCEVCKAKVIEMGIPDTGNLLHSVGSYFDEASMRGFIRVSCDYAVFVEFGTGTKGMKTPYISETMSKSGYKYMGGTSYVTLSDGRIGWYYPADDGTWRFTEGLPSRPFMYETGQELRHELKNIIQEVFSR